MKTQVAVRVIVVSVLGVLLVLRAEGQQCQRNVEYESNTPEVSGVPTTPIADSVAAHSKFTAQGEFTLDLKVQTAGGWLACTVGAPYKYKVQAQGEYGGGQVICVPVFIAGSGATDVYPSTSAQYQPSFYRPDLREWLEREHTDRNRLKLLLERNIGDRHTIDSVCRSALLRVQYDGVHGRALV